MIELLAAALISFLNKLVRVYQSSHHLFIYWYSQSILMSCYLFQKRECHTSEPGQSGTVTGISLLMACPDLHAALTDSLSPVVVFIQMDKRTLPLATSRLCFSFFLHPVTVSFCKGITNMMCQGGRTRAMNSSVALLTRYVLSFCDIFFFV